MHTVGVDIGTTTIGYVVVAASGSQISFSNSRPHRAALPSLPDGCQDVDILFNSVTDILAELQQEWGYPSTIGISGQMHGILYLNRAGEACSPLYTWLYEGALPYIDEIAARSGYALSVGYGLATHYANQQQDKVPPEAVGLCTIMDYVVMKLGGLGSPVSDPTCAASIGIYDIEAYRFDRGALRELGIDASWVPSVIASASPLAETAEKTTIVAPIGDNQASYLGACLFDHKRAGDAASDDQPLLLNIGTSAQIAQSHDQYATGANRAIEWRPLIEGRYLVVGSVLCGGKTLEVLAHFYADIYRAYTGAYPQDIYAPLHRLQENSPHFVPETPLAIDTCFAGSRANPSQRGTIRQIGIHNLRADEVTYGAMEGIIDELYGLWQQCALPPPSRVIGSGNALRANPLLQRLASTRWGVTLRLAANDEEAAVGAAFIAQLALDTRREKGISLQIPYT